MHARLLFFIGMVLGIFVPLSFAANTLASESIVEQLQSLTAEIRKDAQQMDPSFVYLGSSHVNIEHLNTEMINLAQSLIRLIQQKKSLSMNDFISNLKWIPSNSPNITKLSLINAAEPTQQLRICQASFLGPHAQGKAIYPGQQMPGGCRISYGGYAFVVSKFNILAGKSDTIQWIPLKTVQLQLSNKGTIPSGYGSNTSPVPLYRQFNHPYFNFDISIQGSKAVAGGIENGVPMLICRVKQNDSFFIGKLVFLSYCQIWCTALGGLSV